MLNVCALAYLLQLFISLCLDCNLLVDTIVLVFKLLFCCKSCVEFSYMLEISLVPAQCWISRRLSSAQMQVLVNAMSSYGKSILPAHKLAVAPPPCNPSAVHHNYCPFGHQRHYTYHQPIHGACTSLAHAGKSTTTDSSKKLTGKIIRTTITAT